MAAIQLITQLSIFGLIISLFSTASLGDDKLVDSKLGDGKHGYVLAPLHTEFHRAEVSSKASAILIVNANAMTPNQSDDLLATCRTPLKADLRSLSERTSALLLIRIQYTGGKRPEKDIEVRLKEQLKELAISSGYPETQISEEWTSSEWESGSGLLGSGLMDDRGEESLIINKTIVAAPLRTRISKLHTGMSDAFIKLRSPFDARNLELSEQSKEVIRAAVRSMKLDSARKLHFYVSSTKAGADVVDTLFSNRQPPAIPDDIPPVLKGLLLKERESFKKSAALQLAQELGFQDISYTLSSNGGAPEMLLDSQAPSFELKDLDGGLIKWPEWRRGRPALITFWGLACGPCRLEAPHLSRLHEKYSKDIAILGINAYDETRESILDYVLQEKLKHKIVVGGGALAKSPYNVGAYPTTFWINRDGQVVRYVVGFETGEQLEAELVEFLANQTR